MTQKGQFRVAFDIDRLALQVDYRKLLLGLARHVMFSA
jgi:hypothetical protein